jgi:hypothetical protein
LSELRDTLGGRDLVNSEKHLEAMVKQEWRCIWRTRSTNSEMQLNAVMVGVWRCTGRPGSSEFGNALGGGDRARLDE